MGATFVKNTYDQLQTINDTITINIIVRVFDKFALKVFNRLAYNWEISGPLVANSLLGLSKHYTILYDIKSINIKLLRTCFHKFTLNKYNQTKDGDNFVVLQQQTDTLSSFLNYYSAKRTRLQNFCLYDYIWVINIILCKKRQPNDIKFADYYKNAMSYMQCHIIKNKPFLVKLLSCLYNNIDNDDDLSINNSNSKNNDIVLVLLSLFILWKCLPN